MSLIKCPECNNDISENASSCPICGNPMKEAITTIELTSKRWKKIRAISMIIFIPSVLMTMKEMMNAFTGEATIMGGVWFLAAFIGFIGLMYARIGAWWTNR